MLPRARDSVPVPGVRVVLHRVGRAYQGPIDSTVADRSGAFPLPIHARHRRDLPAERPLRRHRVLLAAGRHGAARPIPRYGSWCTTPRAPPPWSSRRGTSSFRGPASDGSPLGPRSDRARERRDCCARVAADSAHPSWSLRLPAGTGELQVGESDVSPTPWCATATRSSSSPARPGAEAAHHRVRVTPTAGGSSFPSGPAAARSTCWSKSGTCG